MSDNGSVGPTPGPWRVDGKGCSISIVAGDYFIANAIQNNGNPKNDANARLIAAAPELAEALRELWLYARGLEGIIRNGVYRSEELNDPDAWAACDDWACNGEGASIRQQVGAALQKAGLSAGEGC